MKTLTYKKLVESSTPAKYVGIATEKAELSKNQYYLLIVEESNYNKAHESPYVKGVDPHSHSFLIGVEKTSGKNGFYASKDFFKRKNLSRGTTHIVEIESKDLNKFCIL